MISYYIPNTKFTLRDMINSSFLKRINDNKKKIIFLNSKKNFSTGINTKVIELKINRYRSILWLICQQLGRTELEKRTFPRPVSNQSLELNVKIYRICKIINFLNLNNFFIFFLKFFLSLTIDEKIKKIMNDKIKILILFGSSNDPHYVDLLLKAKKYNIKTVLVLTNWDNATSKAYLEKPDLVCCWGDQTKRLTEKIHNIKAVSLGTPRFLNNYSEKNIKINKFKSLKILRLKKNFKYILYAGARFFFNELGALDAIDKILIKKKIKNIKIIYRPHPYSPKKIDYKSILSSRYNNVILDTSGKYIKDDSLHFLYLFKIVSGFISPFGTGVLDAAMKYIPSILYTSASGLDGTYNWTMNHKFQPHLKILKGKWPNNAYSEKSLNFFFLVMINDIKNLSNFKKRNKEYIDNMLKKILHNLKYKNLKYDYCDTLNNIIYSEYKIRLF